MNFWKTGGNFEKQGGNYKFSRIRGGNVLKQAK